MRFAALLVFALAGFAHADVSPTASPAISVGAAGAGAPSPAGPTQTTTTEEEAPKATFLNLGKAETKLLASICEASTLADENFLYNLAENQRADKVMQGVAEVNVMGLYTELANRTVSDDHDAGRALTMAILRGDKRAKEAKQLAFENKLADSIIKRIGNGDLGAKEELEKLAAKGNDKARAYLGLDKPAVAADISATATVVPASVSPTTKN